MTTVPPQHRARYEKYAALAAQNLPPEEIASRLGVQPRTARLYLRRHSMWEEDPLIAADDWAWAQKALTEGVPISWVAETIKVSAETLAGRWRKVHGNGTREFAKVWPSILHSPKLFNLHAEFAPKNRG